MNWLRVLLGLVDLGSAGIEAKKARELAKIELETARLKAKAQAATQAAQSGADWELAAVQDARTSWKDEYWTVILSLPLLAAFVPGLDGYIARGFDVIGAAPDWYKWAVGAAISFAFARRTMPIFSKGKSR